MNDFFEAGLYRYASLKKQLSDLLTDSCFFMVDPKAKIHENHFDTIVLSE